MEWFLRPDNLSIWREVQELARAGNISKLEGYVAEVQRMTSPFRIIRYVTAPAEVEGKAVSPQNVLILNIVRSLPQNVLPLLTRIKADAARDPSKVPNADKFDPARKQPEITGYSTAQHECFGRRLAVTFLTGMVKLVAGLENLRPAPGQQGIVKTINVGSEKIYLSDNWSYFAFNTSSKCHYGML